MMKKNYFKKALTGGVMVLLLFTVVTINVKADTNKVKPEKTDPPIVFESIQNLKN